MNLRLKWAAWILVGAAIAAGGCGGSGGGGGDGGDGGDGGSADSAIGEAAVDSGGGSGDADSAIGDASTSAEVCDSTGWCWETDPQPFHSCWSPFVRERGDEWAVCAGAVVRVVRGQIFRYPVSTNPASKLLRRDNGEIWLAPSDAVYRFDGSGFVSVLAERNASIFASSGGGDLWVSSNVTYRRWSGATFDAPITRSEVLCFNDAGEMVIATDTAFVRVRDGVETMIGPVASTDGERWCIGRSLLIADRNTGAFSLQSMDGGARTPVASPTGLRSFRRGVRGEALFIDAARRVYRANADGTFTALATWDLAGDIPVWFDVDPASGDALAIRDRNVYRFNGTAWSSSEPPAQSPPRIVGVAGQPPSAMLYGDRWTRRGPDGQWISERYPDAVAITDAREMLRGIEPGAVISGSGSRFVRWQPSGLSVYSLPAEANVAAFFARSERDAWMFQSNGRAFTAQHWDGARWTSTTTNIGGEVIAAAEWAADDSLFALSAIQSPPDGRFSFSVYNVASTTVTQLSQPQRSSMRGSTGGLVRDGAGTMWVLSGDLLYFVPAGTGMLQYSDPPLALTSNARIARSMRGVVSIGEDGTAVREFDERTRAARVLSSSAVFTGPMWSAGDQLWVAGTDGRVVRRSIAP